MSIFSCANPLPFCYDGDGTNQRRDYVGGGTQFMDGSVYRPSQGDTGLETPPGMADMFQVLVMENPGMFYKKLWKTPSFRTMI